MEFPRYFSRRFINPAADLIVMGRLFPVIFCWAFLFPVPGSGCQDLVRPESHHLATLVMGLPTSYSGAAPFGVLGTVVLGGEQGLNVWQLGRLPGITPPLMVVSLAGVGAQGVGNGFGPFMTFLGLLDLGHQYGAYQVVDPNRVLPLSDFLLDQVRDREPIGEGDFGAYLQAVTQSGRREFQAFWEAGKANLSLTRGDLMNRGSQVRGRVVRGEGVVRRIRRLEPLPDAVRQGVAELYECWIFQDLYGANPICVVTTRLGDGLAPAENVSRKVRFAGYFLKSYRYAAAQTVQGRPVARECPLIIGPELVGVGEPAPEIESMGNWPKDLIALVLGAFAVALTLVWAMTWWMKSGDDRVRKRLNALKGKSQNQMVDENLDPAQLKDFPWTKN